MTRKSIKRPVVMVSSAVYMQEELLRRVYDLLTGLGYDVNMSYKGTIAVDCYHDTLELCLKAVENCDLFLGLITTQYGTTKDGSISITHAEMRKAIELRKPRWFLVHEKVVFARQLLAKLGYRTKEKRQRLTLQRNNFFSDLRIIDMYEEAENLVSLSDIAEHIPEEGVKWVQNFNKTDEALLFANAQFSRYQDLEYLLRRQLAAIPPQLDILKSKGEEHES